MIRFLIFTLPFSIVCAETSITDSVFANNPIAEYCVKYGKKEFQKITCKSNINSTETHLYLDTILQMRPPITACSSYEPFSYDSDFENSLKTLIDKWTVEFLIDKGLEAKGCEDPFGGGFYEGGGYEGDRNPSYVDDAIWYFANVMPVFAKNKKTVDLSKYYGKSIPVKWQLKSKCESKGFIDSVNFSGSYFIRITGECDSSKTRWFEK